MSFWYGLIFGVLLQATLGTIITLNIEKLCSRNKE